MVEVTFSERFERKFKKFAEDFKIRIRKQIKKFLDNPEVGKPMKHNRKGTREVYVGPFRLSYSYSSEKEKKVYLISIIKTNNN